MIRRVFKLIRQAHDNLREAEQLYMVLLALIIGLGGGFCAVGFRMFIGWGNTAFWQQADYTLEYISGLPFWWKILAPAVGGGICGLIIYYFAREAKGHGVPEVMDAVALRGGRIRPRVVLAKMAASGISIASGGSVGREGPIVQIGSAIGSTVGQWLKIDERRLRTLVGCGAAAGIAGTFNAPIAGALFSLEIILFDFGVSQFSPIVISSVAATVVGRAFLGNVPAFVLPKYALVQPMELFAYAALGIFAGLVALAFVKTLYKFEDLFDKIHIYPPLKAVFGGALIGVIALKFPEVYGVGYEAIETVLQPSSGMAWYLLLALVGIKILAVSITIGSGGSGGIFAPSLFIGAMAGGMVGTLVHAIWPEGTAGPGAYALVGMGAVVAAGTHAPITAILILFELTDDYEIILPLMISCIIATLLSMRLQSASIYTLKLLRRGVDIQKGKDINVLRHLSVRDAMRGEFVTVSPAEPLMPLLSKFVEHPGSSIFVVEEDGRLRGVITGDVVRTIMTDASSFEALLIAQDMMVERDFPTAAPTDTLADIMQRLARYRGEVPVVEEGRLVGVVWPEDVIQRYNAELFKRNMAGSMVSTVSRREAVKPIPAAENTSMAEIPVPPSFVSESLAGLDIRRHYNVTVLLVKRKSSTGEEIVNANPGPDYVFQPGDILLIMGPNETLRRLELGVTAPESNGQDKSQAMTV